jgi:hypothetical protein
VNAILEAGAVGPADFVAQGDVIDVIYGARFHRGFADRRSRGLPFKPAYFPAVVTYADD